MLCEKDCLIRPYIVDGFLRLHLLYLMNLTPGYAYTLLSVPPCGTGRYMPGLLVAGTRPTCSPCRRFNQSQSRMYWIAFSQVSSPQLSAIIPWGSILGTWWAGSLQHPMDPGQFAYGSQPTNSLQHPTARFWFFEAVLCHDGLAWLRLAFLYLDPKTISPHTGRVGSCARHWGQRLAETIWETRLVAIKAIICLCCSFRFFLAAILWNAACIKNDTK